MSLGILPVVALVAVIVFSGASGSHTKNYKDMPRFAADGSLLGADSKLISPVVLEAPADYPLQLNSEVETPSPNQEQDFNAIRRYISSYKTIGPEEADSIAHYLVDYGQRHEIDPKLAAALIARESGFNRNAISKTGAKGLGQLKDFNFPSLNISNPFDVKENIGGTTAYLKNMMRVWKDKTQKVSLAIGSYYKGHNAIKRDNGQVDSKTNAYVRDILKHYHNISALRQSVGLVTDGVPLEK